MPARCPPYRSSPPSARPWEHSGCGRRHDADVIGASDEVIDIGPQAGEGGGELVFQGSFAKLARQSRKSLTAKFMHGFDETVHRSAERGAPTKWLKIFGAEEK